MPNFNLLRRIPIIHEAILSGQKVNKNTIRELLAKKENAKPVSVSTVGNIIEFLRDELYAPIEYNAREHSYYYTDESYVPPLYYSSMGEKTGMSELSIQKFAQSIDMDYQTIFNLVDFTDMSIPSQEKFDINIDAKYCGRSYYDGLVWIGLKVFSFSPNEWQLAVGFLDDYADPNKTMTQKLQVRHLNYIAEDAPLDQCYYLYHIMDKNLLKQDKSVVQHAFKKFIDYVKKENVIYCLDKNAEVDGKKVVEIEDTWTDRWVVSNNLADSDIDDGSKRASKRASQTASQTASAGAKSGGKKDAGKKTVKMVKA